MATDQLWTIPSADDVENFTTDEFGDVVPDDPYSPEWEAWDKLHAEKAAAFAGPDRHTAHGLNAASIVEQAVIEVLEYEEDQHPRGPDGKWTSGGGGSKSDTVPTTRTADGIVDKVKAEGGLSVKPATGEGPTDGYMVAFPGSTIVSDRTFFDDHNGARVIRQFVRDHAEFFDNNGWLGLWHDQPHHEIAIDRVENFHGTVEDAKQLGSDRDQQSIWDVIGQREIPTGGTGGREESVAASSAPPGFAAADHGREAAEEGIRDDRRRAGGVGLRRGRLDAPGVEAEHALRAVLEYDEDQHPRDADGKWTSGGGGDAGSETKVGTAVGGYTPTPYGAQAAATEWGGYQECIESRWAADVLLGQPHTKDTTYGEFGARADVLKGIDGGTVGHWEEQAAQEATDRAASLLDGVAKAPPTEATLWRGMTVSNAADQAALDKLAAGDHFDISLASFAPDEAGASDYLASGDGKFYEFKLEPGAKVIAVQGSEDERQDANGDWQQVTMDNIASGRFTVTGVEQKPADGTTWKQSRTIISVQQTGTFDWRTGKLS